VERLHLGAGAGVGAHARLDHEAVAARAELDLDVSERQRVAERDRIGGALGGEDAGQPRHLHHAALGEALCADEPHRRGRDPDPAPRHGLARGHGLGRDIDHSRSALRIEMAEAVAPRATVGSGR